MHLVEDKLFVQLPTFDFSPGHALEQGVVALSESFLHVSELAELGAHGVLDGLHGGLQSLCLFGEVVLESSDLVNALADGGFEGAGEAGVEGVSGADVIEFLEGAVDGPLVLVLGFHPQRDSLHEGVGVVEVFEVVGEQLTYPGKYLLHCL